MGNSETNLHKQNKKSILISHKAFDNAKIVRNNNGKQTVQIEIPLKSQKDFMDWQKNYKRIPRVNSVLYPQQAKYQHKGCCGSSGIAHIQYQKYPYVLAQQIGLRRNNNQGHFDENQLWLLLYSLVTSGEMFHLRKLKVGDIRPQNIFLNSQGQIKVASQYSYPYGQTNYQKTLMNRQLVTYLAPQQVKDIQFGKMKDLNDPNTVQTFSMGLTMLDAALLSSSDKFYGNNGVFNYDRLNQSIKSLNRIKYSSQLISIITRMCQPQASLRLKSSQVAKLLNPYQKQILSKKPFNLKGLPSNRQSNQNPQQSINDISHISKKNNNQVIGDYKFVPGIVFESKDDSLMLSSLKHTKEIAVRMSKVPQTYQINKQNQLKQLNAPVQTTIHYPPITISLPQPIQQQIAPQYHNGV